MVPTFSAAVLLNPPSSSAALLPHRSPTFSRILLPAQEALSFQHNSLKGPLNSSNAVAVCTSMWHHEIRQGAWGAPRRLNRCRVAVRLMGIRTTTLQPPMPQQPQERWWEKIRRDDMTCMECECPGPLSLF